MLNKCIRRYFFFPSSQRSKEVKKEKIIKKIMPDLRLETSMYIVKIALYNFIVPDTLRFLSGHLSMNAI